MLGVGGEFSWIVSSQAVASGPHLLFCKFKQSLVFQLQGRPMWIWGESLAATEPQGTGPPVALNTSSSLLPQLYSIHYLSPSFDRRYVF